MHTNPDPAELPCRVPVCLKRERKSSGTLIMGPLVAFLSMIIVVIGCHDTQLRDETIRVMTFNIRYANPNDGEHVWENRKDWVAEIIRSSGVPIVGIQEALRHQIDTLVTRLPNYNWIGAAREDGKNRGEFSPLFYRSDILDVEKSGTFWLSPVPQDTGSVGWDAALPRVATWARFKMRRSDFQFFVINSHFDHRGQIARLESARILHRWVKERSNTMPVVLMGDFNTIDSDPAYLALTGEPAFLTDTAFFAESGSNLDTFRGFEVGSPGSVRIDYVFVTADLQPVSHLVLDSDRNGSYPSDHLPIVVEAATVR